MAQNSLSVYKRNVGFLVTLGFAMVFSSTREFVPVVTSSGLVSGGFGGLCESTSGRLRDIPAEMVSKSPPPPSEWPDPWSGASG